MSISLITDSTGTTLNQYTLKESGQADKTVQLVFSPSDDYVAGSTFSASTMNPIINAVNNLTEIITGTLIAGQTSVTLTNSRITSNSIYDVYTSIYGVNPDSVTISGTTMILTFSAQTTNMTVGIRILGTY